MNEAKLNFCQGMSEAFRTVWFDISIALTLPEEDLRAWLTAYKDQTYNSMDEWLSTAGEALREDK